MGDPDAPKIPQDPPGTSSTSSLHWTSWGPSTTWCGPYQCVGFKMFWAKVSDVFSIWYPWKIKPGRWEIPNKNAGFECENMAKTINGWCTSKLWLFWWETDDYITMFWWCFPCRWKAMERLFCQHLRTWHCSEYTSQLVIDSTHWRWIVKVDRNPLQRWFSRWCQFRNLWRSDVFSGHI